VRFQIKYHSVLLPNGATNTTPLPLCFFFFFFFFLKKKKKKKTLIGFDLGSVSVGIRSLRLRYVFLLFIVLIRVCLWIQFSVSIGFVKIMLDKYLP
jgi:hypothetical protein